MKVIRMEYSMANNIYLIGFMGVGKSAVAKELQKKLDLLLIEMDQEIVNRQGMEISEIFAQHGESFFRDLESSLIREIANGDNAIVSCGGGAVLRKENVDIMQKSGMVVLLTAEPETILARVGHSAHRPLLEGKMNVDAIREMMEQRKPAYENACQYFVPTDGKRPAEIADGIAVLRELRGNV